MMKNTIIITIAMMIVTAASSAQAQYYNYGYGGYGHASTLEEGYARGIADILRSHGVYHQLTADAAVRFEEARRKRIDNYKRSVETYHNLRANHKARHSAKHSEKRERRLYHRGHRKPYQPPRLSDEQLNPVTGELTWPKLLLSDDFRDYRTALEPIFLKRVTSVIVVDAADQAKIESLSATVLEELKNRVRDVKPTDYIIAQRFLKAISKEAARGGKF